MTCWSRDDLAAMPDDGPEWDAILLDAYQRQLDRAEREGDEWARDIWTRAASGISGTAIVRPMPLED